MVKNPKTPGGEIREKRTDSPDMGKLSAWQRDEEFLIQSFNNQALGALLPGFIHQINNPLNNIFLTLDTLMENNETLSSQDRSQLYQEALEEADRAVKLLNTFLEFSLDSPLREKEQGIEDLLDKTIQLLAHELKKHHIKIVLEAVGTLPSIEKGKGGLWQVLVHLILDRIHALPNGGQINILLRQIKNDWLINISDKGMAWPPETIEGIFYPFPSTITIGTGDTFSLRTEILQKWGGCLEVQNNQEKGTSFFLRIPMPEAARKTFEPGP